MAIKKPANQVQSGGNGIPTVEQPNLPPDLPPDVGEVVVPPPEPIPVPAGPPIKPPVTEADLINAVIEATGRTSTQTARKERDRVVVQYLEQIASAFPCAANYNVVALYDYSMIAKPDADRVYRAVTKLSEKKPLLLMLYSYGGSPGSAYLIGKLCREHANGRLVVTVPRVAKSAATLICCAADEIHLGSMSELGPIDPQIDGMPALGLKNAVEQLAELTNKYPAASDMFAKYLNLSLKPIDVGYYERVAESAKQYAQNLLTTHEGVLSNSPQIIADQLVYKYKDHGFVIDKVEAEEIFGPKVIKTNTCEYDLGNRLYSAFEFIRQFCELGDHVFYFIGSLTDPGVYVKRQNPAS